ncbi:MAG: DUF3857 domain-containing protein [Bacteroidales bacterium]|nr:DUF3857 domain-containing protein [Bacteroidales bacterium]
MKNRIILLLLLVVFVSIEIAAQRVGKKSANREMGFKADEDFNVTVFPDKWKEESAIILCQKYDFSYVKHGLNKINFREVFRKRVFINDQKAKDEFSIFYYIERDGEGDNVGFIVEKPDGEQIKVDLKDAVEVGANEVSSEYRSYYSYKKKYKKIAIPNLEVGDIVDYFVFGTRSYDGSKGVDFAQFSFSLPRKYPILKQKFYFNIDKGFKVNYRAFNGAPTIAEGVAGVNKRGQSRDDIKTYLIEDDDRDKRKSEIWKYNTLEEPWIKFQVYYAPGGMASKSYQFISKEEDLVNSPMKIEEIKNKVLKDERTFPLDFTDLYSYIKREHKELRKPEEKAEMAYYYFRYWYFSQLESYSSFDYEGGAYASINYMRFTNIFSIVLDRLKVPYKYVIASDRGNGGFDNVIFANDVTTGIRVGDKYYFFFDNNSTSDYTPSYIVGSDAIEFYTGKKHKDTKMDKTKIPTRDYNDNSLHSFLEVKFSESMDTAFISNRDSLTGSMKSAYEDIILYKTMYMDEDRAFFYPEKYKKEQERKKRGSSTKLSKRSQREKGENTRLEKQKEFELNEWRSDFIIDFFKNDYELGKVDSVVVVSSGRMLNSTSCVVESYFRVGEIINKAGRNYILDIGALIGYQLELDTEDMERKSDVNIDNQVSYNYNIEVQIPEGYYVEGIDALNYNVVNEVGEFTSNITIEGNVIKLHTSKKYKTIFSKKDDWNMYIAFLEAAYEFSQKKLIIKKNK